MTVGEITDVRTAGVPVSDQGRAQIRDSTPASGPAPG